PSLSSRSVPLLVDNGSHSRSFSSASNLLNPPFDRPRPLLFHANPSLHFPKISLADQGGKAKSSTVSKGLDSGRSTLLLVASRNARSRNTIAPFWTRTQSWNLVSWSELFSLQGESHEQ